MILLGANIPWTLMPLNTLKSSLSNNRLVNNLYFWIIRIMRPNKNMAIAADDISNELNPEAT